MKNRRRAPPPRRFLHFLPFCDSMDADRQIGFIGRDVALNRSKEACHCRNVTYGMIEAAIRNGADSLQQVMEATGAGKGCGKCKEFLGYLVRDIKEELKNDGPSA